MKYELRYIPEGTIIKVDSNHYEAVNFGVTEPNCNLCAFYKKGLDFCEGINCEDSKVVFIPCSSDEKEEYFKRLLVDLKNGIDNGRIDFILKYTF